MIGIVLLQLIDDGTDGPIGDGGNVNAGNTTVTTAPTGETGTDGSSTTTTTAATPAKPPAEVAVLVLNGSGRAGAAATQTNSLKAEGYQTLDAVGRPAPSGQHRVLQARLRSRVHDDRRDLVGGAPTVEPVPDPPPTGSENASCVVILGS